MTSKTTETTGVTYTLRGYDYMSDSKGGFIVMKNGAVVAGPLASQDEVRRWVAEAKRNETQRA